MKIKSKKIRLIILLLASPFILIAFICSALAVILRSLTYLMQLNVDEFKEEISVFKPNNFK